MSQDKLKPALFEEMLACDLRQAGDGVFGDIEVKNMNKRVLKG